MRFLIQIYKNEITIFSLISVLFVWGAVTSLLAFQNKTQVILIGQTDESYQLITEEKKAPLETINFIRHFLSLTLNFDEESYKRHISLAGDLMTESLWKTKKPEFIKMAGFIKQYKIVQSSEILSIKEIKPAQYEVEVKSYLFKKGVLTEKNKLIWLFLAENERSFENPWRHSVFDVEIK